MAQPGMATPNQFSSYWGSDFWTPRHSLNNNSYNTNKQSLSGNIEILQYPKKEKSWKSAYSKAHGQNTIDTREGVTSVPGQDPKGSCRQLVVIFIINAMFPFCERYG